MRDEITQKRLKDAVLARILGRKGKSQAIPYRQLTEEIRPAFRTVPDLKRKVRDATHELRRDGVPICSKAGRGVYYPEDLEEVLETAEDLERVARDLHYTAKQIRENGRRKFGSQQKLF